MDLVPGALGAQIGSISVGGDWIASNAVAGVTNLGADGYPGGTGADRDNINFGDSSDVPAGISVPIFGPELAPAPVSRIASIIIGGIVAGTEGGGDHFGFSTAEVGAFKSLNFKAPLSGEVDRIELSPATGDVTLREV